MVSDAGQWVNKKLGWMVVGGANGTPWKLPADESRRLWAPLRLPLLYKCCPPSTLATVIQHSTQLCLPRYGSWENLRIYLTSIKIVKLMLCWLFWSDNDGEEQRSLKRVNCVKRSSTFSCAVQWPNQISPMLFLLATLKVPLINFKSSLYEYQLSSCEQCQLQKDIQILSPLWPT